VLASECIDEIEFDRRGFIAFAPYLYLNDAHLAGDIVWARDMRDGNRALWMQYPDRQFYRYTVSGEGPRFVEFDPSA